MSTNTATTILMANYIFGWFLVGDILKLRKRKCEEYLRKCSVNSTLLPENNSKIIYLGTPTPTPPSPPTPPSLHTSSPPQTYLNH